MAFIGNLLAPYALKLLAGLAILGAIAAVLMGAKNAGRTAEKVEGMQRQLKNVQVRNEIEHTVATVSPAERVKLRNKWERD